MSAHGDPTVDAAARTLTSPGTAASSSPATGELVVGTLLKGSYRVERRLGEGGMGTVWLAEHVTIQKKVAIKVLGAAFAGRPEIQRRFLREARASAAISDDHVIEIHDFGETADGAAFIVMEYLQGSDLAALLEREGPLPWPRARALMLQICRALQAAHARGIVHRDVKPANCFCIDRDGGTLVKVLDFGLAKVQDPDDAVGKGLTHAGSIFGTPEYMSPEQARGDLHDHRVDVYSAGVLLFQMLTGRVPFLADTFMGLLHKHMYEDPPRPSAVAPAIGITPAADAVVLKALHKDPHQRFQSMTELAEAIALVDRDGASLVAAPRTASSPRRGPLVAALGLVAAVGLGLAWSQRDDASVPPPADVAAPADASPAPSPPLVAPASTPTPTQPAPVPVDPTPVDPTPARPTPVDPTPARSEPDAPAKSSASRTRKTAARQPSPSTPTPPTPPEAPPPPSVPDSGSNLSPDLLQPFKKKH